MIMMMATLLMTVLLDMNIILNNVQFGGFKSSGIKTSVVCLVDSGVLKTLMHYIHYKTLGPLTQ